MKFHFSEVGNQKGSARSDSKSWNSILFLVFLFCSTFCAFRCHGFDMGLVFTCYGTALALLFHSYAISIPDPHSFNITSSLFQTFHKILSKFVKACLVMFGHVWSCLQSDFYWELHNSCKKLEL